jgi:hypothetical protein
MLPVSAMSDAANKLRNVLLDQIDDLDDVKRIRIGHPNDTIGGMDAGLNNLNLFFYNVSYDGYPADGLSADPFYVRLYCLITAVGAKTDSLSPSAGENDLRLIGEVMRVLHQQPVLSVDGGNGVEVAELQVVPHSLDLDNLNHIWSTQGDTAYRLSVAYEMSLAPVPLSEAVERSALVGETGTGVRADMDRELLPDGGFGIDTTAPVVPGIAVDVNKPDWSPHICFVDEAKSELAYSVLKLKSELPASGFLQLKVFVAGKISGQVDLVWDTWSATTGWVRTGASQTGTIAADRVDPDQFFNPLDPTLALAIDLPIQDKGQATLYAERSWQRPDGSTVTLRSNPLLVTVYEAGT